MAPQLIEQYLFDFVRPYRVLAILVNTYCTPSVNETVLCRLQHRSWSKLSIRLIELLL